ncbi:MAG TPA: holo-ACP synthase [Acidobacteriota bacterium]|nr:holo-ACP synthase [Acidobacteriota bacterium]
MIIGIGVDIVEVERMRKAMANSAPLREKVFTENEIRYCGERKTQNQNFAGRFAAKEAVLKALGTGWSVGIRWTDVETLPDDRGKPQIVLHGKAKEIYQASGANSAHVTITHSEHNAVAVVILERRD